MYGFRLLFRLPVFFLETYICLALRGMGQSFQALCFGDLHLDVQLSGELGRDLGALKKRKNRLEFLTGLGDIFPFVLRFRSRLDLFGELANNPFNFYLLCLSACPDLKLGDS